MFPVRVFPMNIAILAMMTKHLQKPHFMCNLLEDVEELSLLGPTYTERFFLGTFKGAQVKVITYIHLDEENWPRPLVPARGTLWFLPEPDNNKHYLEILVSDNGEGVVTMEVVDSGGEFDNEYVSEVLAAYQHALTITPFG